MLFSRAHPLSERAKTRSGRARARVRHASEATTSDEQSSAHATVLRSRVQASK